MTTILPADDYVVAVPSYQRADKLQRKTLPLLLGRHVPAERVYVFVHETDPQLPAYEELAAETGVNCIVTPAVGIQQQRAAIRQHFPEGQCIVSMDDDIDRVMLPVSDRWSGERQVQDLDDLFSDMFQRLQDEQLYVWGLAPVYNPFFLKPGEYTTGLNLVLYTLYGFINRPESVIHQQTAYYKDDYETSLRAWWYDGGTLRNKGVAAKAEFYTGGGCQAEGREYHHVDESVEALLAKWPGLLTRAKKRTASSGWPEVRMARRKRTTGHPETAPLPGDDPDYVAAHQRKVAATVEALL